MNVYKLKVCKSIIVSAILLAIFSPLTQVLARDLSDAFKNDATSPLGSTAGMAGYETQDTNKTSIENIIATVIQTILSFLGVIFLLLVIYGGYNWMTASGDNAKVELAKNTITRAVIGLIVVISAYAISYLVINSFGATTLNTSTLN